MRYAIVFISIFSAVYLFSQKDFEVKGIKIGEHIFQTIETPHPYPSAKKNESELVWQDYYFYPGASYIVFRFKNLDLAKGDWIEILDEDEKLIEKIEENSENFLTKMVFSEGAIINLYSKNTGNSNYGYLIDRITYGYPDALDIISSSNESLTAGICGQNDLKNAICYAESNPEVYNKAKAVAKVIFDGSQISGTAFLCSCENHILTNYHVIPDQQTLNISHFIFDFEDKKCSEDGGDNQNWQCIGATYKIGGYKNGQYVYDYSLIELNNCDPQSSFGFIKLNKDMNVSSGHKFFIAGHPGGRGKEITYENDRTYSGICEIKNVSEYQCPPFNLYNAAYSFLCNVEGGSSGSPMVSLTNYRAIGIAHCEGCPDENIGNKGVMLSKFISEITPYLSECAYKYTISGKINGNSTSDICDVKIFVDGQQKALSNNDGTYETIPLDKGGHYLEPKKGNEENGYYCFNPKNTSVSIDYDDLKNVDFDILYYDISGSAIVASSLPNKPLSGVQIQLYGPSPGNVYTDSNGNFAFSGRLCGDYTITAFKNGCDFPSSPYSFTLSYSNYNVPTFNCFLKILGRIGPIFPSNSTVNVSGMATNGDQINQTTNVDSFGYFKFSLPEGNYTFTPYSECNVFYPPLLQANIIYEKPISLDFTTTFWKICSSCYSTYFAREYECSNISGEEKDLCLSNAKIEFKNCAYLKTKDANSLLYNAIILAVEVKRAKGKPEEEVFEFNVEEEGDYFINLTNGNGLQKETTLSSAKVVLDGEYEIFSPNDFNKNVFKLSKVVNLVSGFHNIKVQVESKPDAYITILVSDRDIKNMPDLP